MMRIITGTARGTRLDTLAGETTRPTPERVKEAVFSAIQFDIEQKRFLDLFAGSGQMGLEALSRGASRAVLIDRDPDAVQVIKTNAKKTKLFDKCFISNVSYRDYLKSVKGREQFDFIYIDPPFAENLWADVLERVAQAGICHAQTVLICESESRDLFEEHADVSTLFEMVKQSSYGRVISTFLRLRDIN